MKRQSTRGLGQWYLGLIAGFSLLMFLVACANEGAGVPTAVPEAVLPEGEGIAAVVELNDDGNNSEPATTPVPEPEIVQAAPGELAPLPRLESTGPGQSAGSSTAVGGSGAAELGAAQGTVLADPFSNTTFTLAADLPPEPAAASVIRTTQASEVNLDQAQDLASRFGFAGDLYLETFPDVNSLDPGIAEFVPPTIYYAFDGQRTFSLDPWSANYQDQSTVYNYDGESDFETAVGVAESFLQERQLLDFPYALQPGFGNDIFVVREIEGYQTNQPEIIVGLSEEDSVSYVSYQVMQNMEDLGAYPLISADEGWQRLQAGVSSNGIAFINYPTEPVPVEGPSVDDFQSWSRLYQPGESVQLFGWPNAFIPANGSGNARVQLFPYLLDGAPEQLNQIAESVGQQIRLTGTVADDQRTVNVSAWSVAQDVEPFSPQGIIQRAGDEVTLVTDNGQTFILPNVPADIPDGLEVIVFSWTTEDSGADFPLLQWESIDKLIAFDGDSGFAEPLPLSAGPGPDGYQAITIDEVDLAYFLTYIFPDNAEESLAFEPPTILLQPAWRFSGEADNSDEIEFFVQAVTDDFVVNE